MKHRTTAAEKDEYDSESVEIAKFGDIQGGRYDVVLTRDGKNQGGYVRDAKGVPVENNTAILCEIIDQYKLKIIKHYAEGESEGKTKSPHQLARKVIKALRKKAE